MFDKNSPSNHSLCSNVKLLSINGMVFCCHVVTQHRKITKIWLSRYFVDGHTSRSNRSVIVMLYIYGSREWKLFSKILEVVAVSQRLQWSGIYVVRKEDMMIVVLHLHGEWLITSKIWARRRWILNVWSCWRTKKTVFLEQKSSKCWPYQSIDE